MVSPEISRQIYLIEIENAFGFPGGTLAGNLNQVALLHPLISADGKRMLPQDFSLTFSGLKHKKKIEARRRLYKSLEKIKHGWDSVNNPFVSNATLEGRRGIDIFINGCAEVTNLAILDGVAICIELPDSFRVESPGIFQRSIVSLDGGVHYIECQYLPDSETDSWVVVIEGNEIKNQFY